MADKMPAFEKSPDIITLAGDALYHKMLRSLRLAALRWLQQPNDSYPAQTVEYMPTKTFRIISSTPTAIQTLTGVASSLNGILISPPVIFFAIAILAAAAFLWRARTFSHNNNTADFATNLERNNHSEIVIIDPGSLSTSESHTLTFTHPSLSFANHASPLTNLCIVTAAFSRRALEDPIVLKVLQLAIEDKTQEARRKTSEQRHQAAVRQDKIVELESKVTEQAAKLDKASTAQKTLEFELACHAVKTAAATSTASTAEEAFVSVQEEAARLAVDVEQRRRELRTLSTEKDHNISSLETSLVDLKKTNLSQSDELGGLRKKSNALDAAIARITALEAELVASRQQNEHLLQAELTKVATLEKGTVDSRKESEEKQALLQIELDNLRNENTELKTVSLQKEGQYRADRQTSANTIAALKQELEHGLTAKRSLHNEQSKLALSSLTKIEALEGRLGEALDSMQNFGLAAEKAEDVNQEVEEAKKSLHEALNASNKRLQLVDEHLISTNETLAQDNKSALQESFELKATLMDERRNHAYLVQTHHDLIERKNMLEELDTQNGSRILYLQSCIEDLEVHNQVLEAEIESLEQKLEAFEAGTDETDARSPPPSQSSPNGNKPEQHDDTTNNSDSLESEPSQKHDQRDQSDYNQGGGPQGDAASSLSTDAELNTEAQTSPDMATVGRPRVRGIKKRNQKRALKLRGGIKKSDGSSDTSSCTSVHLDNRDTTQVDELEEEPIQEVLQWEQKTPSASNEQLVIRNSGGRQSIDLGDRPISIRLADLIAQHPYRRGGWSKNRHMQGLFDSLGRDVLQLLGQYRLRLVDAIGNTPSAKDPVTMPWISSELSLVEQIEAREEQIRMLHALILWQSRRPRLATNVASTPFPPGSSHFPHATDSGLEKHAQDSKESRGSIEDQGFDENQDEKSVKIPDATVNEIESRDESEALPAIPLKMALTLQDSIWAGN